MLKSDPLLLPGRHAMNLGMLLGNIGAMGYFLYDNTPSTGLAMLGTTTALSSIMGVTLTAAIGGKCIQGGDAMPLFFLLQNQDLLKIMNLSFF